MAARPAWPTRSCSAGGTTAWSTRAGRGWRWTVTARPRSSRAKVRCWGARPRCRRSPGSYRSPRPHPPTASPTAPPLRRLGGAAVAGAQGAGGGGVIRRPPVAAAKPGTRACRNGTGFRWESCRPPKQVQRLARDDAAGAETRTVAARWLGDPVTDSTRNLARAGSVGLVGMALPAPASVFVTDSTWNLTANVSRPRFPSSLALVLAIGISNRYSATCQRKHESPPPFSRPPPHSWPSPSAHYQP